MTSTSSPMTQIVANRYLQYTTIVLAVDWLDKLSSPPVPFSPTICNFNLNVMCAFSRRNRVLGKGCLWRRQCHKYPAALSLHILSTMCESFFLRRRKKWSAACVRHRPPPFLFFFLAVAPLMSANAVFLVVFNVVLVPEAFATLPPSCLGRFVLFYKINFNHSHRNCNCSMINDLFFWPTRDPTTTVPVPL